MTKVKRDTLKLSMPKDRGITDAEWEQMANAVEYFMRLYARYKCIEIAAQMNVHGSANEVIERARSFTQYIFEDEPEDD